MYSCQKQQRAGGSLHGVFLSNILTFFTRFSLWAEMSTLEWGQDKCSTLLFHSLISHTDYLSLPSF